MQKFVPINILLLLLGLAFSACSQQTFEEKLQSLYNNTVPRLQPSELHQKLEKKPDSLYVLDSRAKEEYQISHIPNAKWIGYDNLQKEKLQAIPKDASVILYCSVGYRSEKVGEKLQKWGYSNVYNLHGSIFKWKNQGYQVYNNAGQPTDSVHAYSKKWSQWLKKGTAVY